MKRILTILAILVTTLSYAQVDTIEVGGGGSGGSGIDSLRRLLGSLDVEARKNGIWTKQFKDSAGAGGSGGGTYTASQGLTMVGNDVQLGGILSTNAAVSLNNTRLLDFTNPGPFGIRFQNSSGGTAALARGDDIGYFFAPVGSYAIGGYNNNGSIAHFEGGTDANIPVSINNGFNVNNNTVTTMLSFLKNSTSTPAVGIGMSVVFDITNAGSTIQHANRLVSKLVNVGAATSVSEFSIMGLNNNVESTIFALTGTGAARLNKYGINTFAGTAAFTLGVDASGNIVETATGGGGGTYTASRGLNAMGNNFRLGGTLDSTTVINANIGGVTITSASAQRPLTILNTTGTALYSSSNSATGVIAESVSSFGATISSTTGIPLKVGNWFGSNTNGILPLIKLERGISGNAANGIGLSIDFANQTVDASTFAPYTQNQIISRLTDAVEATLKSELSFTGTNNNVMSTLFTLSGNGRTRFNKYGINTFAGVPTFALGVDASGNVVEFAAGGGGGSNWTITGSNLYRNSKVRIGSTVAPVYTLDVTGSISAKLDSAFYIGDTMVVMAKTSLFNYFFGNSGNLAITSTGNTSLGADALRNAGAQDYNTAIGYRALMSNTSGFNTVVGAFAAQFATGSAITAMGTNALRDNTTGGFNTAIGSAALVQNTTGTNNTAIGATTLTYNLTGTYNTAVGNQAQQYNRGAHNTSLGAYALTGTSTTNAAVGWSNTVVGYTAMIFNANGNQNNAFGDSALYNNTSGSGNIAMGYRTLWTNTTGSNNTVLGSNVTLGATVSNTIAIGIGDGTIRFSVAPSGLARLSPYGAGTFTGTPAFTLGVTSAGDIIEMAVGSGLLFPGLAVYENNIAAIAGGLPVGKMYRTSTGVVKVRF